MLGILCDAGRHGKDEMVTSEISLATSLEILISFLSAFLQSTIMPRGAEIIEMGAEYRLAGSTHSISQRVFLFS